jgi:protein-tyrosine phosphatase
MNGITPIIAHPERYKAVQENIYIVADWLESGCLIQIDAGSPIGLMGKKAKLSSDIIIKNNWCQIIGSDAHDNKSRNLCIKDSFQYINSIIGDEAIKLVNDHPRSVILGDEIDISVNYENLHKKNIYELMKEKMGF